MTHSRTFRVLFVGSLMTAIVGVIALTGCLVLWPEWREHRLVRDLDSKDDRVRQEAKERIAALGTDGVPILIKALNSDSWLTVCYAEEHLEQIGPQASEAVPALIRVLKKWSHEPLWGAMGTLRVIGPEAKEAVPTLLACSKLPGDMNWGFALDAIRQIDPGSVPNRAEIIDKLKDKDPQVREWAVWMLGMETTPEQSVPLFAQCLEDPEPDVRCRAAGLLYELGPAAKEAVPALVAALANQESPAQEKEITVRGNVLIALQAIAPEGREMIPALVHALRDLDSQNRERAARALGKFGAEAQVAVPMLTELVDQEPGNVAVVTALWRIEKRPENVLPYLIELLGRHAIWELEGAASLLSEIGPDAASAVPALVAALNDPRCCATDALSAALKKIDPEVAAQAGVK